MNAPGGAPTDEDLRRLLDVARDALNQEIGRAERYDAKARSQMTLAASWFAVVQALAAVAIRPNTSGGWIVAILFVAVVAGLVLSLAMIASARVWKLRDQSVVTHETLQEMLDDARQNPGTFGEKLVQSYRELLDTAQSANRERAASLEASLVSWWFALGAGFVEACVALVSRVGS